MKDASAAKKHSTSPPLEDRGDEDEEEEENRDEDKDEDADAAEDSDEEDEEAHGGAAGEQGAGDGKSDEEFSFVLRALLTNAPNSCPPERLFSMFNVRNFSSACSMPFLERIRDVPSGTTLSWQCSRSTTNAISELLWLCVCVL